MSTKLNVMQKNLIVWVLTLKVHSYEQCVVLWCRYIGYSLSKLTPFQVQMNLTLSLLQHCNAVMSQLPYRVHCGNATQCNAIVYRRFMPPRTLFMEGCLNEQYWGVDGLNKNLKNIKDTVYWWLQMAVQKLRIISIVTLMMDMPLWH